MCVNNDIVWSEIGSEFGDLAAHPHQEFPGVPHRAFSP